TSYSSTVCVLSVTIRPPPAPTLVPYTTLFRSVREIIATRGKLHNPVTGSGGMLIGTVAEVGPDSPLGLRPGDRVATLVSLTLTPDRKSTRLNSSHVKISYAVFCLKKKTQTQPA